MNTVLKTAFYFTILSLTSLRLHASAKSTIESTLEEQLEVALKRQEAGRPFDAPLENDWQDFF